MLNNEIFENIFFNPLDSQNNLSDENKIQIQFFITKKSEAVNRPYYMDKFTSSQKFIFCSAHQYQKYQQKLK